MGTWVTCALVRVHCGRTQTATGCVCRWKNSLQGHTTRLWRQSNWLQHVAHDPVVAPSTFFGAWEGVNREGAPGYGTANCGSPGFAVEPPLASFCAVNTAPPHGGRHPRTGEGSVVVTIVGGVINIVADGAVGGVSGGAAGRVVACLLSGADCTVTTSKEEDDPLPP